MKLSITVHPPEAGGGSGAGMRIFEREVQWPWLPVAERDLLGILHNEEADEWYAHVEIRHVWFNPNGPELVELVPFQVDPVPEMRSLCDGRYRSSWNTSIDGDLYAQLLASGWTEWQP
jgi:hypothetical protein